MESMGGSEPPEVEGEAQTPRKPRENFDIALEDADIESTTRNRKRKSVWSRWRSVIMGTRERKTYSPAEDGDETYIGGEEGEGLLSGDATRVLQNLKSKSRNSWYERCLCGGNISLSILATLLVLNLLFGSTTYFRFPSRPDPFKLWGAPGTTSEGLSWYPTDFLRDINPVPCHSHNDYWRKVPLFTALYAGCISIEADVWKTKYSDELLVGHNTASLTKNRTFASLYVNPLVEILERQNPKTDFYNGTMHGVFDTDSEQGITLLVDVKTDGKITWPEVVKQLEPLRKRNWLTYFEDGKVHQRPVTVVGTGETPFDLLISNTTYRDYFFDAPLDQMYRKADSPRSRDESSVPLAPATIQKRGQGNSGTSPDDEYTKENSWYASTEFSAVIGRTWWGKLSDAQLELIRGHVRGAHARGLKVRYWGSPSWPTSLRNYLWDVLVKEGVDVINADDVESAGKGSWV